MSVKGKAETAWGTQFDTVKREKLFRQPPKDKTAYPALAEVFRPHIDSFDAVFRADGRGLLDLALQDIGIKSFLDGDPTTAPMDHSSRNKLSLRIRSYFLDKSRLPQSNKFSTTNREIYPAECRERHATYRGALQIRLEAKVNDGPWKDYIRDLGRIPLMLRSSRCHLQQASPAQLVSHKEESEEFGGYFIVNGNEKIVRLLIVPKRNYPMALIRPTFGNRGPTYTKYAIQLRSVRADQSSITNTLHYLDDGNVMFRFSWRKNEYVIPVMMILTALVSTTDREIAEGLLGTGPAEVLAERQFTIDRVELLLRTYKSYALDNDQSKTRAYLGARFKERFALTPDTSDEEAGAELLRKVVLPHLGAYNVTQGQDKDKFNQLLFMTKKLYALVEGQCSADNPDAASNQEILLGGFLYGNILKEKLEEYLLSLRPALLKYGRANGWQPFTDPKFLNDLPKLLRAGTREDMGQAMEYFLSTGNLTSPSGLDLQQTNGFTIIAEKLNYLRFISHFRCVHRGAFFAQLKTTTVRKLLPESWGFLCPVHTPDGAPCGLINHLAHKCKIATHDCDASAVPKLVAELGVTEKSQSSIDDNVAVQLDGRVLGYCSPKQARHVSESLRHWKVEGTHGIPIELEIGYIPNSNGGQYPGIYMFSHAARMYRPVKHLGLNKLDYVGPFEQPHMSIACTPAEIEDGYSTHVEEDPTNILSILANMTPFSDYNQSPRNMYQVS
ncbi:hypothetical protein MRB53_042354 [Persea americana]|nr:hypothetical protein MRB53_042354 [Persea americana]